MGAHLRGVTRACARGRSEAWRRPGRRDLIRTHRRARRRDALLLGALTSVFALSLLFLAPTSSAMPSNTADTTWATDGHISAIVQVGNLVVVGGTFTSIVENGGLGPSSLPRNNLAAFDATTGAPAPAGWAPNVNGAVSALAVSADGTRVYAGGSFTSVDGVTRNRIAAFNTSTGALDTSWKPPTAGGSVLALAVGGSRLYLGGSFVTLGGQTRNRLGAIDAATAALDASWQPSADQAVRALAVTPGATRVFAGGDFTTISGSARRNAVALDPATGAVDAAWHPDPAQRVLALLATSTTVYGGVGGSANTVADWDSATGATRWAKQSDGDFQALALAGNVLYAGGHYDYFEGRLQRKLVALDATTGALRKDWTPDFDTSPTTWGGVWALSTDGTSRLEVGGDFAVISGVTHQHFAQFTGDVTGTGDRTPPTTPANVTATAYGGSKVGLAWSASSDSGGGIDTYRIFRNGVQIGTSPSPSYSDLTVQPNTTYTYQVSAVDYSQNVSPLSSPVSVTTGPPDQVLTFGASDDATIESDSPAANFGSATTVSTDTSPLKEFLIKFNVSGLAGRRITSAKLRLFCTGSSNEGGQVRWLADSSWNEGTVTWNNAPAADPAVAAQFGAVSSNTWYQLDLTSLVRGDGTISLRVTATSPDGADYSSRQGKASQAPQLVVNVTDPANAPPQPVFSDGFESGDLSKWTSPTGLVVQQQERFSGAWAARATSNGAATWAYAQLPAGQTELYSRFRVKLVSQSTAAVLYRLRTGTGTPLLKLYLTSTGKLAYRNDVSGVTVTSTTGVPAGAWHTLDLHALVNGSTGHVDVSLDGVPVAALSNTESLGTTPIGRIQLGDDATAKTYDLFFDDVVADSAAIPDTTPPSAPTGLTATALSATSVRLNWTAASDDLGVTGYRIYRDHVLLTTVGAVTTYTDGTVSPATTYQYEVRALDGGSNVSPPSNTATVTTSGQDTTAPTAPTQLQATAVSFNRVDLAWQASTDDTGVSKYTVYRDGSPLADVNGTTTTYTDTTVTPAHTYTYTVRASDAANNTSPDSNPAATTTPQNALFSDGFESGNLSQWTNSTGLVAQQQEVFEGSWAARATTTGSAAYAEKQLAVEQSRLYYRTRFKIVSQASTSTVILMKVRTAGGTSLLRLYVTGSDKLATRNDFTGVTTTSTTNVSLGAWHLAELRTTVNGTSSTIEVLLDGTLVTALSKTDSLGATPIGRIQLGDDGTGKTYDVGYDSVLAAVMPTNDSLPTVTGTPQFGQTLTADAGTWSGTSPIAYAYQWRRCDASGGNCVDIGGATGSSYTLAAADVGATVRVTVTATNVAGSGSATSNASAVVTSTAPSNTSPPTISGTAQDGQTLTAGPGSWAGSQPITYAYQWRRCDRNGANCVDIASATASSYALTSADVGATIRVTVTATNAGGSGTASSDASGVVAALPPSNTSPPTISGTAQDGQTLTAHPGSWAGSQPLTYTYQWRRCNATGGSCADIPAATASSYTLTLADVGATIRVAVTATNAAGADTATSSPSDAVLPG
jgi:fibronectin type 3 domain-containing protein